MTFQVGQNVFVWGGRIGAGTGHTLHKASVEDVDGGAVKLYFESLDLQDRNGWYDTHVIHSVLTK